MGRRLHTIFGLAAAATIVLIAGTLLLLPGSAPRPESAGGARRESAGERPADESAGGRCRAAGRLRGRGDVQGLSR